MVWLGEWVGGALNGTIEASFPARSIRIGSSGMYCTTSPFFFKKKRGEMFFEKVLI
jgi:hypothetical protein